MIRIGDGVIDNFNFDGYVVEVIENDRSNIIVYIKRHSDRWQYYVRWEDELSITHNALFKLTTDMLSKLQEYKSLPRGWDGYDAESMNPIVISCAENIVNDLAARLVKANYSVCELSACPISDGRADIEVQCEHRRLILEIDGTDNIGVYYNNTVNAGECYIHIDDLHKWINWVSGAGDLQISMNDMLGFSNRESD